MHTGESRVVYEIHKHYHYGERGEFYDLTIDFSSS